MSDSLCWSIAGITKVSSLSQHAHIATLVPLVTQSFVLKVRVRKLEPNTYFCDAGTFVEARELRARAHPAAQGWTAAFWPYSCFMSEPHVSHSALQGTYHRRVCSGCSSSSRVGMPAADRACTACWDRFAALRPGCWMRHMRKFWMLRKCGAGTASSWRLHTQQKPSRVARTNVVESKGTQIWNLRWV